MELFGKIQREKKYRKRKERRKFQLNYRRKENSNEDLGWQRIQIVARHVRTQCGGMIRN